MNWFLRINSILLGLVVSAAGVFAQAPGASATWRVQKYDLNVTLPGEGRTLPIKASLAITNVSGAPAGTLTLRISPSAEVLSVKVNDAPVDFSKSEEKASPTTRLQRIVMRFASVAPGGGANVAVDYKLNVKDNSAVAGFSTAGAQFLPLSYWYPTPNSWYFARGADAAPFRLAVNGAVQTVVSAGVATAGVFDEKLTSQPFFVAGNWDVAERAGVSVYLPKGTGAEGQKRGGELADLFNDARTFCAAVFGKAPDVPLRILASGRGAGFSEAGTVIVDDGVFRRWKIDSLTAMNIAEAAAKLWLGSSVNVSGDGHGVITEGLSRYIATQFIESKFGKDVADVERMRQRVSYAAVSKRDAPLTTVAPVDDYYYPEVANKGAMVWRIVAKRAGQSDFNNALRAATQDGKVDLGELRAAFALQKELLDYLFDKVTDMNLMAGVPAASSGGETKIALRNTGSTDATVDVTATTASGERLTASTTIRALNFGEIGFKTPAKIVRAEVDSDKMYPQMDYSDDVAPRETTDSDPLLAAKRLFDKQDFAGAEELARKLLRDLPRFDDLRILLGRALLAQNKTTDAEKEFRAVLAEKLPTARSVAWANVGLADAASRSNRNDAALKLAEAAIAADAEYGASLAARNVRNKVSSPSPVDAGIKAFFSDFDRAATANKKSDVEALILPGEITRFASGVAGSTQQWQTQVTRVDSLDANTILVEANLTIKLLNKDVQTGMAVYRLAKVAGGLRLAAVDMFEVR
jgi:hypothetical protein